LGLADKKNNVEKRQTSGKRGDAQTPNIGRGKRKKRHWTVINLD